eukprot:1190459-Prorocentrum_minimum.AAC.2
MCNNNATLRPVQAPAVTINASYPGGGTNRPRGKSIYLEGGPIDREERVYTWRGDQSTEEREGYIPGGGTNRPRRGKSIYLRGGSGGGGGL